MPKVNYDQLENAVLFSDNAEETGSCAYVSLQTGAIYYVSDLIDEDEEELPEDIETSDLYVRVPSSRDLELGGRALALRFTETELPSAIDEVEAIFSRKGAFARFSRFLASHDAVDRWHQFRDAETDAALRSWCKDNQLDIEEARPGPG